ncbi:MAG: NAD-dependent epimerase/dehydratase family protein [Myxococcota bacterium]|nr:NAD-dependent epimerase/dehydratase family protein [Myxococcota bacterium]
MTELTGDLRDDAWFSRAAEHRPDAIVHTAAVVHHSRRGGEEMHEVNVGATVRLVRPAARAHCRMIFVSTSGTVGCSRDPDARPDEDAPFCEPVVSRWPYYASKIEAERQARALADELGVELVIVRPPVMLGPGDWRLRSTGHIARLLRGRVPFIVPGSIHFVDVRDVSAALVRLISLPRPRIVYNMPGTSWSLATFFEQCARLGGVAKPRQLPGRAAWLLSSGAEALSRLFGGDPGSLLPDPVAARRVPDFRPSSRPLRCASLRP